TPVEVGDNAALEPAAGINWLPYIIFGVVAVGVFLFLLVTLNRAKQPMPIDSSPTGEVTAEERRVEGPPYAASFEAITAAPARLETQRHQNPEPPPACSEHRSFRRIDAPQSDLMAKAKKQAAGTLFTVAGLQLVCGLMIVSLIPDQVVGGPVPKQAI